MATLSHPTRAEQETTLRWDREDDQVHVWSASPVTWRKLERLGIPVTRETKAPDGRVTGRFYTIPLCRFHWGLKRVGVPAPGCRVALRSPTRTRVLTCRTTDPLSGYSPDPTIAAER
jgi:hypothetical protein